jgi:GNAT superfamily N-acetyltransferase
MHIRRATREDGPAVVELIRCLADFEKLPPPDAAAEKRLLRDGFELDPPRFEVWVVTDESERVVAYAACFQAYSTFRARPTLFLEDLFVHPSARRRGIATRLLEHLRDVAIARECGRFEWFVLDWNEDAKALYRAVGAEVIPDWRVCRVDL